MRTVLIYPATDSMNVFIAARRAFTFTVTTWPVEGSTLLTQSFGHGR